MKFSMVCFPFARRSVALAGTSVSLIIAIGASTSIADTLPPATSTVSVGGGIGGFKTKGPLPSGLNDSYDQSSAGGTVDTPTYVHEVSSVQTSIGPGMPLVGSVDANAAATASGPYVSGRAGAGGSVIFYFHVTQIKVPTLEPLTLPVYFEANGEGSVADGYGSYNVFAQTDGGANFHIQNEGYAPIHDSFDKATTLDLAPEHSYQVFLGATADAFAPAGTTPNWSSHAEAIAAVDPIIRLDQAAFDARYGSNSFPLVDYYQIRFSPNVPEPSTIAFVGTGLVGLIVLSMSATTRGNRKCGGNVAG